MTEFDHDRLDVYRAAMEFVALANGLVERLPRGRGYLADQLQRASTSIALNIAEGSFAWLEAFAFRARARALGPLAAKDRGRGPR